MIELKQPSENLVFEYDFAGDLGETTIAAIVSVTCVARDGSAALTNVSQAHDSTKVRVAWSGGTDAISYLTTVVIDDNLGQRFERDGEIRVLNTQWTMPDGGAAYLSIAKFVENFGLEEVVRLTDVLGDGRIDRSLLVSHLTAVQSIVDVHLSTLYVTPLAAVPAIVETAMADMVRARLYREGAPDGIAAAAAAAQKLLERISEGRLPLPSLTPIAAAPTVAPVAVSPGTRQYPDGLKDY